MNINKDRLAFLLKAHTENRISDQEKEELSEYLTNEESGPALQELMQDFWAGMEPDPQLEIPKENIYQSITEHPEFKAAGARAAVIKPLNWRGIFARAAAVLVILASGIGAYRYSFRHQDGQPSTAALSSAKTILPGMTKAVLTLADGSTVVLEKDVKKALASQSGVVLLQDSGQLTYRQHSGQGNTADMAKNSISTPRGGEYQVHLEDGTVVWLNSGSSITYPVAFTTNERRVQISGEAYFEVAKNPAMPFVVEANGTEVKVLGTHFNVNAYADDDAVKTTLVEGSVRISKNGQYALLKPDQQALTPRGSDQIQVTDVDAMEALAWKNGIFLFNNENIKNVMKVISRWYDIDVAYGGDVSGKTFGGTISRFENFEKLLKTLELTGAIHFKIQGRRVTVMP